MLMLLGRFRVVGFLHSAAFNFGVTNQVHFYYKAFRLFLSVEDPVLFTAILGIKQEPPSYKLQENVPPG